MKAYLLSVMSGQAQGICPKLITFLLWPFSLVYAFIVFCHRHLYSLGWILSYQAPKTVVSIGNVTVGGVGKTPLVVWLVENLQNKGIKAVVLMRGFMPQGAHSSDEADMLNEQIPFVPVMAGANRVVNIKKALMSQAVDCFICDDAFQHWPLKRDLDIVAINATNPFGNGFVLPAGILREGLGALRRADIFVLTKVDQVVNVEPLRQQLAKINSKAVIVESRHRAGLPVNIFTGEVLNAGILKNQSVLGFSAIGDPSSFKSVVNGMGVKELVTINFIDHHVYQPQDIKVIVERALAQKVSFLVTTHKDAVKLKGMKDLFKGIPLMYVPVKLEITRGSDEFIQRVISVCRR